MPCYYENMFTGIIEEIGTVKSFLKEKNGARLEINANIVLQDIKLGDSISVNGVCQTVTEIKNSSFCVMISDETLAVTTFNNLKTGDYLNLERALTINTRLGGHIVSGHVDCRGKLVRKEQLSDFYNLYFEIPEEYLKYIVYKGSVTINGISLTVAQINDKILKIAVIPHTFENTNLKYLNTGESVNIETDILAKYVENLLKLNDNNVKNNISMEFLAENGFV